MEKQLLNTMFENLLHIGNKTTYWNPRMKDYIYGSVNGVHVINLTKTIKKIEEVKKALEELTKSGKVVLIVATKLQAKYAFRKLAEDTGHPFVTEKWVPGLLTNYKTLKKRINTYVKLQKDFEVGAYDVLTKKEKATKKLELEKLDAAYCGLKDVKKLPDAIFVIDSVYEKQAVKEANTLNIPVYAIANTNGNDLEVTDLIPANTNSVKSLEYLAAIITPVFAVKKPASSMPTSNGKI
jgi:small subunit ribosomal protein S2